MRWFSVSTLAFAAGCGVATGGAGGPGSFANEQHTAVTSPGCTARSNFRVCQVSSGATVLGDGGVINGTESCTDACTSAEQALSCTGNAQPNPASDCRVIPVPTPNGVTDWCCPIDQGS